MRHGWHVKSSWCVLSRRSSLGFTCIWLLFLVFGLDCAGTEIRWSQWFLLASKGMNPWLTLHCTANLGLLHFVSKISVFLQSQPLLICLCKHRGSHPCKISETKCFKFFCEVPPQDLLLLYSTSELLNHQGRGNKLCSGKLCHTSKRKPRKNRAPPAWEALILVPKRWQYFSDLSLYR